MIRMLKDTVLIKKVAKEQVGALVMPESIKDDWERGEVVAVGSGRWDGEKYVALEVEVGDVVIYLPSRMGSFPVVNVDGEDCIILSETNIAAVE